MSIDGQEEKTNQRAKIIYARVSSQSQQADLHRQSEALRQAYPDHELVTDIASGLNWHRKGLISILERTYAGLVAEIVVAHKDRLARFGSELLLWIFNKAGTRLVVLDQLSGTIASSNELADDLMAITTFFVARNNGRRAAENRRKRKAKAADCPEQSRNKLHHQEN